MESEFHIMKPTVKKLWKTLGKGSAFIIHIYIYIYCNAFIKDSALVSSGLASVIWRFFGEEHVGTGVTRHPLCAELRGPEICLP